MNPRQRQTIYTLINRSGSLYIKLNILLATMSDKNAYTYKYVSEPKLNKIKVTDNKGHTDQKIYTSLMIFSICI